VLELWDVGTLTLGLRPKQGLAGGRAKRKPGVTFHAPGNVRKCEGINSHSQGSSHFGSWSPDGFSNFRK